MWRMGLYDQLRKAFQDIVAPEIQALRGEIHRLDAKIDGMDGRLGAKIEAVDAKVGSLRNELLAEIRRLDGRIDGVGTRIDGLDRHLSTAIDVRERIAALEARQRA